MTTSADDDSAVRMTIRSALHKLRTHSFLFEPLTAAIQDHGRCWVTFTRSYEYELPAVCLTQIAEWRYQHHRSDGHYIPHHLIVMNPACSTTIVQRIAVAHEIGHILLHFPKYVDDIIDGTVGSDKVTEDGIIQYSDAEETEAFVFAAALCLLSGDSLAQARIRPDEVASGIETVSREFDANATEIENVMRMARDLIEGLSCEADPS